MTRISEPNVTYGEKNVTDEYRLIPLTRGMFAKVDAADYDWLMEWKWHAIYNKANKSYYAATRGKVINGKRYHLKMHRLILGLGHGDRRQADHIHHDTLDNRRSEIRIVTCKENVNNPKIPRRLRNVYIEIDGHKMLIGILKSKEEQEKLAKWAREVIAEIQR